MRRAISILIVVNTALLSACGSESSPPPASNDKIDAIASPDPGLVLRDLGLVVIVPTLQQFRTESQALTDAARSLCEALDGPTLSATRDAWRTTRGPWKQSEAFRFGPVTDLRIDSAVDFWPIRLSSIQTELAKDTPVPEDYAAGLGDTLKGLPVIEYLLFDGGDTNDNGTQTDIDAVVLARLRQDDGNGSSTPSRTCNYLIALTVDVANRAQLLYEAWSPENDNFANALATSGEANGAYDDRSKAIGAIVNAFVGAVQEVESTKLATPLGLRDGGTPNPQAAESWRSDNGKQDILDNLAGIRSMYRTTYNDQVGVSFSRAVAAIDPVLDNSINAQIDAAIVAVEAISTSLDRAVIETPDLVDIAFQANKELFRLMAVDMVNTLGVTLSFSDNDGD